MINEKDIEAFEQETKRALQLNEPIQDGGQFLERCEKNLEIYRLARVGLKAETCLIERVAYITKLGLWAEKYGIPALDHYKIMAHIPFKQIIEAYESNGSIYDIFSKHVAQANEALATLPEKKVE